MNNHGKSIKESIDKYLSTITTVEDTNVYQCTICKDTEIIVHNKQQLDEYTEWCECHKKREVVRKLEKSGLPRNLIEKKLSDFNTIDSDKDVQAKREEMKQKALEFVKEPKGLFYASGMTGGGKTFIGSVVAKNVANKFGDLEYMRWSDEMAKAKRNYGEMERSYWTRIKEVDVLYIDDFMKKKYARKYGESDDEYHKLRDVEEFEHTYAYNLMNYRAENNKVTIISTEYSLDEMRAFDEAIEGRIVEMIRKGGKSFYVPNEEKYNYRRSGEFK